MLKRKHILLATAAVAAATPLVSKSATVTFAYDSTVTWASNAAFTTGVGSSPIVGNIVNVPVGDFFEISVNADVTNNPNGSNPDPGTGAAQPSPLGLSGFGFAIADSNTSTVVPRVTSGGASFTTTGGFNNNLTLTSTGTANTAPGDNGTNLSPISGGVNPGNDVLANKPTTFGRATIGAGTAQDIFSGLIYRVQTTATAGSSSVLTPTNPDGSLAVVAVGTPGQAPNANSTGTASVTYTSHILNGSDTVNALPSLTVIAGTGVTTTTHPIVSLTAQGSQGGSYTGNLLPLLHVVGSNGSYVPAFDHGVNTATGAAEVIGFSPATDNETYALKLVGLSSTPATAAIQIAQIITDINAASGTDGVLALLPTADVASIAPGYQIELTATTSKSGDQSFGFDFSQETNVGGITVSDIVAVPEPTTIGLLLGASSLLLGRRKRNA
jgi:hypothetical protein